MTEQQRQDVALFRYGVIGPLVSGELCHGELKGKIRELSMRRYTIPFSSRSSIGFGTIEEWLSNFRHKGFDGLKPKPRNDRGTLRGVRAQLKEDLLRMRMDNPKMSVDLICRELIDYPEIQRFIQDDGAFRIKYCPTGRIFNQRIIKCNERI